MAHPHHDPLFAAEVDAYISDDSAHDDSLTTNPIARDRSHLQNFHAEALSFLAKSYAKQSATSSPVNNTPLFELDPPRLDRFHAHAVSFLDRAYANQQDPVSPSSRDRELLKVVHHEAMHFLDAAAGAEEVRLPRANTPHNSNSSSLRIERDKARLEQHYQDAMSFLNRAEKDGQFVEEQELELAAVERFQLQKYAREAMSFLDKAFREDASVMVDDEELSPHCARAAVRAEEDRQIAADRAALERYDQEVGQFLNQAYEDDSTVFIEDADSDTSGTERRLYARRMAPSTASEDTACSPGPTGEDFSEEAYTDDEFQDVSLPESAKHEVHRSLPRERAEPGSSSDLDASRATENIQHRIERYEREAADYLDGANVSEEEVDAGVQHSSIQDSLSKGVDVSRKLEYEDEQFGADVEIDEEQSILPEGCYEPTKQDETSLRGEYDVPKNRLPDRVEPPSADENGKSFPEFEPQEVLVDVRLEDKSGKKHDWSDVPLERSFYRQVPRGSTIKLRARESDQVGSREDKGFESVPLSALQRVEKERDAVLAALEEIVNERSMLAAQVSEMKLMIKGAGGKGRRIEEEDTEEIDLAAELKDAHATMEKLTEEMEATLAVLDTRYQETLKRAHNAEAKCIRLEASASRLEGEFAAQGLRLSQALSEQQRVSSMMSKTDRDFEALRKKAEKDIQKIDESYREESDRSMIKIRELSSEVSLLQEKLKSSSSSSSERRVLGSPSKRGEVEVLSLKRRLGESERALAEERLKSKRSVDSESRKLKLEHGDEVRQLTGEMDRLKIELSSLEHLKGAVEVHKAESNRMSTRATDLELKLNEVMVELTECKREQLGAEAEAKHLRIRYEESLKDRISQLDQSSELVEIQSSLRGLREEASCRERNLQEQLEEFRSRAEQAEAAAGSAERDAREAADVAKLAQERSKLAVESERSARMMVEAEKQAVVLESRAWEKFAQQQMEQFAQQQRSKTEEGAVVTSSSRRGLRKSPSKNSKDSSKKKKETKGGTSEEQPTRKKVSHRARLFGG